MSKIVTEFNSSFRVIKVGGSLMDLHDLGARLLRWTESRPIRQNLWIMGGGRLVDSIRELDRTHKLSPEDVHWWCVDLLNTTGRILNQLVPDSRLITTPQELQILQQQKKTPPSNHIVLPAAFYAPDQKSSSKLPKDWSTTTDSIAAILATHVDASELVLCKSCTPYKPIARPIKGEEELRTLEKWRRQSIVDSTFPAVASRIPSIRCVNLREPK